MRLATSVAVPNQPDLLQESKMLETAGCDTGPGRQGSDGLLSFAAWSFKDARSGLQAL
jgi:hypothetical protein